MRRLLGLVLVMLATGCPLTAPEGGECKVDSDCSDQVCARDRICRDSNEVRAVTITWTINGQPASATTCAGASLYVEFDGYSADQTLGFEPVPCESGRFSVDKLPNDYNDIEVGPQGRGRASTAPIDSQNRASVDLRF